MTKLMMKSGVIEESDWTYALDSVLRSRRDAQGSRRSSSMRRSFLQRSRNISIRTIANNAKSKPLMDGLFWCNNRRNFERILDVCMLGESCILAVTVLLTINYHYQQPDSGFPSGMVLASLCVVVPAVMSIVLINPIIIFNYVFIISMDEMEPDILIQVIEASTNPTPTCAVFFTLKYCSRKG